MFYFDNCAFSARLWHSADTAELEDVLREESEHQHRGDDAGNAESPAVRSGGPLPPVARLSGQALGSPSAEVAPGATLTEAAA